MHEHLISTLREALSNVAKHAHATSVKIDITIRGTDLVMTVGDNGIGVGAVAEPQAGNGLANMRERAQSLGGRFEVLSPGKRRDADRVVRADRRCRRLGLTPRRRSLHDCSRRSVPWDAATSEAPRPDAQPGRLRSRSPRSEREPGQVGKLRLVLHLFGDARREHAPTGV